MVDRCRLCEHDAGWLDEDDLCEECLAEEEAEVEHEHEIRSDYYSRLL